MYIQVLGDSHQDADQLYNKILPYHREQWRFGAIHCDEKRSQRLTQRRTTPRLLLRAELDHLQVALRAVADSDRVTVSSVNSHGDHGDPATTGGFSFSVIFHPKSCSCGTGSIDLKQPWRFKPWLQSQPWFSVRLQLFIFFDFWIFPISIPFNIS